MRVSVVIFVLLLTGCVPKMIPMRASLSETVIANTVTSREPVSFVFSSAVSDGVVQLANRGQNSGDPGYSHTEATTFRKMIQEYAQSRFLSISTESPVRVIVCLDDFSIDQNSSSGGGEMAMTALFGGEINWVFTATVRATTTVVKDGKTYVKTHVANVDGSHVSGIGTGTESSRIYRGQNATEYVHSSNIQEANNKIILQIDTFLDSLGV